MLVTNRLGKSVALPLRQKRMARLTIDAPKAAESCFCDQISAKHVSIACSIIRLKIEFDNCSCQAIGRGPCVSFRVASAEDGGDGARGVAGEEPSGGGLSD